MKIYFFYVKKLVSLCGLNFVLSMVKSCVLAIFILSHGLFSLCLGFLLPVVEYINLILVGRNYQNYFIHGSIDFCLDGKLES